MYWLRVDWEKWLGFIMWTLFVFGYLVLKYADDLKRTKCLLVFTLLLAVHSLAFVLYLRSTTRFPNLSCMFLAPLEAAIAAFILVAVGGARPRKLWRSR